jgi:hypothetical protein
MEKRMTSRRSWKPGLSVAWVGWVWLGGWLSGADLVAAADSGSARRTENVILITTDGLRWEEVFSGVDPLLLEKSSGASGNLEGVRRDFWADDPAERRRRLLPFLWSTGVTHGQLWGNREVGSTVRLANGRNFSYPGYNEFLTGFADPRIDSNDKVLNANTNVLEWLSQRPGFAGRAAAVVNWDVLPWILNAPRAGFPVWSAFEVPEGTRRLEVSPILDMTARRGQTLWGSVVLDSFIGSAALEALQSIKPRAMYISYGETDDWAHEGHYERYIRSAHAFDAFLGELWDRVQSMPEYRDRTALVITTDHGRGPAPVAWKSHGANIGASAYAWAVLIGPDVPPHGERRDVPLVTLAQVASTVAALVGEDFAGALKVAPPIPWNLPR